MFQFSSQQVKYLRLSHYFCARTTPSADTCCLQLDFSIIFDRQKLVFQLEAVNSQWLAIRCYSVIPDFSTCSLNLIWSQ